MILEGHSPAVCVDMAGLSVASSPVVRCRRHGRVSTTYRHLRAPDHISNIVRYVCLAMALRFLSWHSVCTSRRHALAV